MKSSIRQYPDYLMRECVKMIVIILMIGGVILSGIALFNLVKTGEPKMPFPQTQKYKP